MYTEQTHTQVQLCLNIDKVTVIFIVFLYISIEEQKRYIKRLTAKALAELGIANR